MGRRPLAVGGPSVDSRHIVANGPGAAYHEAMAHAHARPARAAAGCAVALAGLCAFASAQSVSTAASLRGAGAAEAIDLAAQSGAALADGGLLTGSTPRRILHFTFDDGPDRDNTPKLLDALDRAGY